MNEEMRELKEAFDNSRELFIALGDHYRQESLVILGSYPDVTVKKLSELLNLSRPATSHHIKILKSAGLLNERKEGTKTFYSPKTDGALATLRHLLDEFEKHYK